MNLRFVIDLFTRHAGAAPRATPAADAADRETTVVAELRELARTRTFLAVRADRDRADFTTLVLAVSDAFLWLDAPPTAAARARMEEAQRLHYEANLRGVRLVFATPGGEPVSVDGAPAYRVACPTAISRLQRRETFRAVVPRRLQLECVFPVPSGIAPLRMPVEDLSCGGLGIRHRAVVPDFMAGWRYRGARLLLSSVPWIDVDLEGVHLARTPGGQRAPLAGYRFVALGATDGQKLQQFVNTLQGDAGWAA